jgi:hypothetical protein
LSRSDDTSGGIEAIGYGQWVIGGTENEEQEIEKMEEKKS